MADENTFFTADSLTVERLSWLGEIMKYYCTWIYPESLHHHPRTPIPPFTFFFSGEACYSLIDRQNLQFWELLYRLPPFRCVFDLRELRLRGIAIEPFRMRSPDQIIPAGVETGNPGDPFWDLLLQETCETTGQQSIGFLQVHSPYMHRSAALGPRLLLAAVHRGVSPEFYGFLDGVHAVHRDQRPAGMENVGESLNEVNTLALKMGLSPRIIACSRSATSRGYSTFVQEEGSILSSCTIPRVRIRDIGDVADRFCQGHPVLSHASFSIRIMKQRRFPEVKAPEHQDPPPLVLFVSHSPYGTEMAIGAITLALACAKRGITTRVVFIEDGVYCLAGHHAPDEDNPVFNVQSVIEATSSGENLEYYSYIPSFKKRGLTGAMAPRCVVAVEPAGLAQVLFHPPGGVDADRQRSLIF